ncbi:MAG: DUF2752 domain-containing protein [Bacteroidales bacterium]|nr:DUF2752 domain-containing protein [Bacteroidales bacterium]
MKPGVIIKNEPYLILNIVLTGVIFMIMLYSGIFSPEKDNYPVVCIHEKLTGESCASCGLSHSFSLILRGRIDEAYLWNKNGMRVFIFFGSQFFMRIFFSLFYIKNPDSRRQLILLDIIGSILIFLIAFMPFIRGICKWL